MDIKKEKFYEEMVKSIENDELTDYALETMKEMNKLISNRLFFKNAEDVERSKQIATDEMLKNWRNFNPDHPAKPNSAFNFTSEIIKRGYAKAWRKLYPEKIESL
jgi:L-rhamnose mutarotase